MKRVDIKFTHGPASRIVSILEPTLIAVQCLRTCFYLLFCDYTYARAFSEKGKKKRKNGGKKKRRKGNKSKTKPAILDIGLFLFFSLSRVARTWSRRGDERRHMETVTPARN